MAKFSGKKKNDGKNGGKNGREIEKKMPEEVNDFSFFKLGTE